LYVNEQFPFASIMPTRIRLGSLSEKFTRKSAMDELLGRHRKESKDLQGKITQLKKSVAQGAGNKQRVFPSNHRKRKFKMKY
jgi:hypothetical protein